MSILRTMIQSHINLTEEQFKFLQSQKIGISEFVRRLIDEAMKEKVSSSASERGENE